MPATTMTDVNAALDAKRARGEALPTIHPWLWLLEHFDTNMDAEQKARGYHSREDVPLELRSDLIEAAVHKTLMSFLRDVAGIEKPVLYESDGLTSYLANLFQTQIAFATLCRGARYQLLPVWTGTLAQMEEILKHFERLPENWAELNADKRTEHLEYETAGFLRDKYIGTLAPQQFPGWQRFLGGIHEDYEDGAYWSWSVICVRYWCKQAEKELGEELSDPSKLAEHVANMANLGAKREG